VTLAKGFTFWTRGAHQWWSTYLAHKALGSSLQYCKTKKQTKISKNFTLKESSGIPYNIERTKVKTTEFYPNLERNMTSLHDIE
jgi:hypothetical protein